jgi:hypothetical protein
VTAPPSALVAVKLTRKLVTARGVLNAGEVAAFPPARAAALIRAGDARRASSNTEPDVHPRQDPEQAWRYVGRPLDDETQWSSEGTLPL